MFKSRLFRPLPAVLIAAIVLSSCSTSSRAGSSTSLKPPGERKAAPEFELQDASGKNAKLSEYRGKVVLLNFWATWCGPCKIEIPWFVDFEQKYRDRGFAVLGVSMDEDGWASVKPYMEAAKMNYRVLLGNDSLADLYGGVDSLPTTFMLDREGKIASTHIGLVSKSDYENELLQLLEAPAKSGARRRAARAPVPALLLGTE